MTICKEWLDDLLSSVEQPGDLLGDKGLLWLEGLLLHSSLTALQISIIPAVEPCARKAEPGHCQTR